MKPMTPPHENYRLPANPVPMCTAEQKLKLKALERWENEGGLVVIPRVPNRKYLRERTRFQPSRSSYAVRA